MTIREPLDGHQPSLSLESLEAFGKYHSQVTRLCKQAVLMVRHYFQLVGDGLGSSHRTSMSNPDMLVRDHTERGSESQQGICTFCQALPMPPSNRLSQGLRRFCPGAIHVQLHDVQQAGLQP